jgi:hypothetical protein
MGGAGQRRRVGRVVHLDPRLTRPPFQRLKQSRGIPLPNVALNFDLRLYFLVFGEESNPCTSRRQGLATRPLFSSTSAVLVTEITQRTQQKVLTSSWKVDE